jgi:quercetin dioxygenase-like cupin family protein
LGFFWREASKINPQPDRATPPFLSELCRPPLTAASLSQGERSTPKRHSKNRMNRSIIATSRNEGPALSFLNCLTFVKATSAQTGGAFGLIEQLAPVGSGSPYHVHRAEDETFYVLEGELEFLSEGNRFVGRAGSCVFLPRDVPHGFRVIGTGPARFLILVSPGGFEGFVAGLSQPMTEAKMPEPTEPDMARLVQLAEQFRLEILGPLPA